MAVGIIKAYHVASSFRKKKYVYAVWCRGKVVEFREVSGSNLSLDKDQS